MTKYKNLVLLLVVFGSLHLLFTSLAAPALSNWLFERGLETKTLPTAATTYLIALFQYSPVIIWIPVSVWLYRDSKRDVFAPFLWAMLVLIAHYQGLIIYLLVRLLLDRERIVESKS